MIIQGSVLVGTLLLLYITIIFMRKRRTNNE
nr:MAG TPA: Lysosome-associated membrane glycoprotein 2 PROTEIN [Caudoviricetes sp.]DAS61760.1 MAG TPA: Lysosome-associated membrane glycoprotein 2 PROTEIN [Caudoviricetes sp.]DAV63848.1 MAG TPA: Lysosome-associated membrane glycoprotein 2 PROTEIN [Caudoviricetes sp.]